MTMRLNLDHILKSQLRDENEPNNHHLAMATEKEKNTLRLGAGKSNAFRYFIDKADVKSRVHSMMANIHKHMKTTAPPRKAVPAIPAPIMEVPAAPSSTKTVASKKSRRMRGGGGGVVTNSRSTVMPISQMKARLTRQSQQLMRRGYSDLNPKSFTNQKRIREVMMQKNVLENMLLQHKRLQRDRQTIALDIQRMRQDLDKIKTKLDTSLQTLNSTRTLYSGIVKKGKRGLLPMAVPSKISNRAASSSAQATKKQAINNYNYPKAGIVIAKRLHSSAPKRRSRL